MSDKTRDTFDLAVIGAGPGGYAAALRAAQHGLKVALIDRRESLGGTCLNVGCIPSKTLLHATELFHRAKSGHSERFGITLGAVDIDLGQLRKEKDAVIRELDAGIRGLLARAKVSQITGTARFREIGTLEIRLDDGGGKYIEADHILIATGSAVASLPGMEPDGKRIMTSTDALEIAEVPARLVVVGAGFIGLEIASVYKRLGSDVIVLEFADRIAPGLDGELARAAAAILEQQGISIRTGIAVKTVRYTSPDELVVTAAEAASGHELNLVNFTADRVLMAVGRRPETAGLDLEKVGIALDERGRIPVNTDFATCAKGIYAIGDVIAGPMLAHKAEEEGIACADRIAGKSAFIAHHLIPSVMYTMPEAASVGSTEEELRASGRKYGRGQFPFRANSRARAYREVEGFVKILADAETDIVLGVHMLGSMAGTLIAQAAQAMAMGATSEDIAYTCQAHPTHSEAVREAALAVRGRAIHI